MSPRDRQTVLLAAVFAVLGFLLVVAVGAAGRARRAEAPRRAQLAALIEDRRRDADRLAADVRGLRDRLARNGGDDAQSGPTPGALGLGAGTDAVTGPGFTVVLDDSEREPADPEDEGVYRVNDADLQLVVNAVWASGAEAVAVNGNRLVATSPIRAAGDTLVVNFRPVNPPYRVDAVGGSRDRFLDSDIAGRFRTWERQFGLRFDIGAMRTTTVPAYSGRIGIRAARPAPAAAP